MQNRSTSLVFLSSCAVAGALIITGCGDSTTDPSGGGGRGANGGGPATGGSGGRPGGGGPDGPINVPPNEWTFVDFPDALCMDGSPTGIAVNPNPDSDDVVIFLQGGNACFNNASCLVVAHPDGYTADTFETEERGDLEASDYF